MVRSIVRVLSGVLLALVPWAAATAQAGSIRGTVSDSAGNPLGSASISVEGSGLTASTAASGEYEVRGVSPGHYTVRVRLVGFVPGELTVTVGPGEVAKGDVTLSRSAVQLAPIDVVIGSRARHTAAEELAVPVDVFPAEQLQQQGTNETSIILQSVSPSINFPRQSVTDAGDIVRPFTLRGLSPDHTLVLLNGWRRHQTALVNNFTYGMGAGSSGVDLNAIPSSALDRIEVLRDGAAAQYGSDAIAGVVNLVLKDGAFTPFVNGDVGQYVSPDYPDDGTTVNVNGGWGIGLGAGSLGLFGEFRDRQPTNRAWADPFEVAGTGIPDEINDKGQVVHKNNPVEQPNHHWGDGLERDALTFANFRMPVGNSGTEIYSFGGYSHRNGIGNPSAGTSTARATGRTSIPWASFPTFRGW
jgi:iron complex outermembrane receptor protein